MTLFRKIGHYLFRCPTFWSIKPRFMCPDCGATYRCYWNGHDCFCGVINLCKKCESTTHKDHHVEAFEI